MEKENGMAEWNDLSEEKQDVLIEEAEKILINMFYCTRDWNAWQYETMTQDDFVDVSEDGGNIEVAKELFKLIQKYASNELFKKECK